MKKKINLTMILTTIICLLPMVLGILLYDKLPEQVPTHFNSQGVPDDYSSKAFACFGLPLFMAGLNILVQFGLETDPKKDNVASMMKKISLWLIPILSLYVVPVCLFSGMGYDMQAEFVIIPVGVLLIAVGNYLPKTRQNYTVGIKLPWTLHSEENWNKTHRFAGFLWILGGFVIVIGSLLGLNGTYIFIPTLIMVFVPMIYSYLLYRKGI